MRDGSKPMFDASNKFRPYLDRDHRESENVRFFAVRPLFVQDLWRSPSRGMTLLFRSTSHGIQALSGSSKAEIRDPRVVVGIHKDIWLYMCQYGDNLSLE
jgi:hypothetical protein